MQGQRLTLDGGAGADTDVVGLFGTGTSRIDVVDTGYDGATNTLVVNGTALDDLFLLRKRMLGLLSTPNSQGAYTAVEKVTYTDGINGAVVLNALAGDDSVVLDDTATTMFVNGGSGNDHFRIGQLYTQLHGHRPRVRDPGRRLLHQLARPADQRRLRRGDDQRRHRRRHVRRVPQQGHADPQRRRRRRHLRGPQLRRRVRGHPGRQR